MKTILIRSGSKDETGRVMHSIEVDGEIKYSGLGFIEATNRAHVLANDGDIILEANKSKPPYHSRVYLATRL
ncbi:MAG: hypothetical protein GY797_10565 [Deltaproteobacteria bacterium]|nr:hypothetical protein [Deltaproteobacteria bacterium]